MHLLKSFTLLIVFCLPLTSHAQDSTEALSDSDISLNQQVIQVNDVIKDQDIKNRLQSIILASQWITDFAIEVNEGIVQFEGHTYKEAHREWAESVANKTNGVVAVINKIEVRTQQEWNLQPAADEAKSLFMKLVRSLPTIATGVVILIITWLLAKMVAMLARKILKKNVKNLFILNLTAKVLAIPVIIIGLYLILKLTGLTQLAMTVLGGTGLAGLIIGIAFRDIAENFLASILISIQRPFEVGDVILINDIKGVAQTVTTRGTVLMTMDGDHVHIPNSTIYKSIIVNLTANPNTRIDFMVGIGYDDNISVAQDLVKQILKDHQAVLNQPEYHVLVANLGASTVNLKVYFWVNSQSHSPSKVKSSVIRLTKRAFDQAGISMPDEAREVVFPEGVHVTTEQSNQRAVAADTKAKAAEPLSNHTEQDLSSNVDEIKQQLKDNPLPSEGEKLI